MVRRTTAREKLRSDKANIASSPSWSARGSARPSSLMITGGDSGREGQYRGACHGRLPWPERNSVPRASPNNTHPQQLWTL